jgi:hypothetical protein
MKKELVKMTVETLEMELRRLNVMLNAGEFDKEEEVLVKEAIWKINGGAGELRNVIAGLNNKGWDDT